MSKLIEVEDPVLGLHFKAHAEWLGRYGCDVSSLEPDESWLHYVQDCTDPRCDFCSRLLCREDSVEHLHDCLSEPCQRTYVAHTAAIVGARKQARLLQFKLESASSKPDDRHVEVLKGLAVLIPQLRGYLQAIHDRSSQEQTAALHLVEVLSRFDELIREVLGV